MSGSPLDGPAEAAEPRSPRRRRVRRLVRRLAKGLGHLWQGRGADPELHLERSGIRFPEELGERVEIGPYVILGDKAKGVEPGFVALRAWTERDTAKMVQDRRHRFWHVTSRMLKEQLRRELGAGGGDLLERALDLDMVEPAEVGTLEAILADRQRRRDLFDALKQDPEIRADLQARLMAVEPKFTTKHFVKLDYVESDRRLSLLGFGGSVRIPADRQKFFLHRELTAQRPRDANLRAVREVLANELMRLFGIYSQELMLVPSQYEDGYPKLLLDAAEVKGPAGEPFEDLEGAVHDGFLVVLGPDGQPLLDQDGRMRIDTGIRGFGRNKALLLALADWDALGSTGGNKGRVGDIFVGIDPGHALEVDLLQRRGDVGSDLSVASPGILPIRSYKNYTIFDQDPLSERLAGMRILAELAASGRDLALFDRYIRSFDGSADPRLDFATELRAMRDAYRGRRDDMLAAVAERLAVDRFPFAAELLPGPRRRLADAVLDLLDDLEKLGSTTSDLSPKGQVRLLRPRVLRRLPWRVLPDEDGAIRLFCEARPRQIRQVAALLDGFRAARPEIEALVAAGKIEIVAEDRVLALRLLPSPDLAASIEAVTAVLDNEAVMAFKHPRPVDLAT